MGPHPERCGYPWPSCTTPGARHGFNGATPRKVWIRGGRRVLPASAIGASMGPHPERCGYIVGTNCSFVALKMLQWGHTPKGVDTQLGHVAVDHGHGASMGPHPERCGYRWAAPAPRPASGRFNGATPRKVWIPPGSSAGSAGSPRRFNGATPRKVWIHPSGTPWPSSRPTASMGPHPERCGYCLAPMIGFTVSSASMGPHPERCGYGRGGRPRRRRLSSFNGATPRKVWILAKAAGEYNSLDQLQWGHTPKGVDTGILGACAVWEREALQWGHTPKGVDTPK